MGGLWQEKMMCVLIYIPVYNKILCVSYCMSAASYENVRIYIYTVLILKTSRSFFKGNFSFQEQNCQATSRVLRQDQNSGLIYTRDYSMICAQ